MNDYSPGEDQGEDTVSESSYCSLRHEAGGFYDSESETIIQAAGIATCSGDLDVGEIEGIIALKGQMP